MDPVELLIQLGVLPPQGGGSVTVPMPGQPAAPAPPPTLPPGSAPITPIPPPMGPPAPTWLDQLQRPDIQPTAPWTPPPSPPIQSPGSPLIDKLRGMIGGNPAQPAPTMNPNLARDVQETGGAPEVFSTLAALYGQPNEAGGSPNAAAIPYAGQPSAGGAPRGGGQPQGPASPAAPAAPAAAPSMVTSPEAAQSASSSDTRDPAKRERLWQMLSIMGSVLAQQPAAGQNQMSQIGKALATGMLYQDSMNRADQERVDKRVEQEQASRGLGIREKQLGIEDRRAGTQQYAAETDRTGTLARVQTLMAGLPGVVAEGKLRQLQAQHQDLINTQSPQEFAMKREKLLADIEHTKATTDYTRSNVDSPEVKQNSALIKALKDGGAIDMDGDLVPGPARTVLSTMKAGFREPTPAETTTLQTYYQDLVGKKGMSPAEANKVVKSIMYQRKVYPSNFGQR